MEVVVKVHLSLIQKMEKYFLRSFEKTLGKTPPSNKGKKLGESSDNLLPKSALLNLQASKQ